MTQSLARAVIYTIIVLLTAGFIIAFGMSCQRVERSAGRPIDTAIAPKADPL